MVLFDAIIAAAAAFAVAWLIARQRSQPIPVRMLLTLAAIGVVVATVLLATAAVPANPVVGALAIMLGGLVGQFAARPGQHRA